MSKITLDNLSDNLKAYLEGLGLSEEQVLNLINENGLDEEELKAMLKDTMSINELSTNSKTVIGAINELFQSANNGKQLIANAIGEPVSKDDTFSAMSSDINGLLSQFKTNMMNNGITVESGDKFKALIDKIATMAEEGEGKGIQFAKGELGSCSIVYTGSGYYSATATLNSNLNFEPTIFLIIIETDITASPYSVPYMNILDGLVYNSKSKTCIIRVGSHTISGVDAYYNKDDDTIYTTYSNSYTAQTINGIKWYAIGVGEEDTTLRDSLASILTEEGVSVTEEDDMASLIGKVDEEFDRKIDVKIGSYTTKITMKEDEQKITINHNLGKTPSFVNIYIPYTSLYHLYGGYKNYLQDSTTRVVNHIVDSRVYYDTDHCFIVLGDSNRYIHAYITDITDTSFSFAMCCGKEGSGYEIHLDSFDWAVM